MLAYQERIAKVSMDIHTGTRLAEIKPEGVAVENRKGAFTIPADTVVIAIGLKAQQSVYDELAAAGKEAYLVGDAVKPGKIYDAFHTAYKLAVKI